VAHPTEKLSEGAAMVVMPECALGVVAHISQDPAMAEGPEQTLVMVVVELVRCETGQSSSTLCQCVEEHVSLVLATLRRKKLSIVVPACQHCWVVMLLLAVLLS